MANTGSLVGLTPFQRWQGLNDHSCELLPVFQEIFSFRILWVWERERSELIRLDCILTKEQKNHGQNKTKTNQNRCYYCISLRNQTQETRERKREKGFSFTVF